MKNNVNKIGSKQGNIVHDVVLLSIIYEHSLRCNLDETGLDYYSAQCSLVL